MELTAQQASEELIKLEDAALLLEYRIDALRSQVEHALNNGERLALHELKTTPGTLKWREDIDVSGIERLLGDNLYKKELKTPTQVKAVLKDAFPLDELTYRPMTRKLARVDMSEIAALFKQGG